MKQLQQFELVVDANGIVLFEPKLLEGYYGRKIKHGENIYKRFTTTDEGDEVLDRGVVVPILGINDGVYRVVIRDFNEPSRVDGGVVFESATFPLHVVERLVIADAAVFWEWEEESGWQDVALPCGYYAVCIRGFRFVEGGVVVDFGYEIVVRPEKQLPARTGSLGRNMQVLCLP